MGGWAVCQTVRKFTQTPIIFLTALGDVENIVKGLEMGADDYMVKPFVQAEFLARVKAHLRRTQAAPVASKYVLGNGALVIDTAAHIVTVNDEEVDLTPREFDLLRVLAAKAGQVVPTAELVKEAWSLTDRDALDNIKPYVHYLRKKIEADPATPRWILTVRGIGYRLAIE
jgi:DNA-binding response OmpR family regulator